MMKATLWSTMILALIILVACPSLDAKKLYIEPQQKAVITSPEDGRDKRVLLFFDLPADLTNNKVEIENAVLLVNGQITDADFGQVDVFPVVKKWKDSENVTWNSPWDKSGGDITTEFIGRSVTMKAGEGKKQIRLNVTFMVKAWLDGLIENHGLMIAPCLDDLKTSQVKYILNDANVSLKITFEEL